LESVPHGARAHQLRPVLQKLREGWMGRKQRGAAEDDRQTEKAYFHWETLRKKSGPGDSTPRPITIANIITKGEFHSFST
jgi:hypothetical protein